MSRDLTYTFHPFNDEWSWDEAPNNDVPIVAHDRAAAVKTAKRLAEEIAALRQPDGSPVFPRDEVVVVVNGSEGRLTGRQLVDGDGADPILDTFEVRL